MPFVGETPVFRMVAIWSLLQPPMPSRASEVMLGAYQLSMTPPCSDSRHFETPATKVLGLKKTSRHASSGARMPYGNDSLFGERGRLTAGCAAR